MAAENLSHYKEFLIILGSAGLIVPLFMRIGINSILAFLLVGFLLGPSVLGQIAGAIPQLDVLVIHNPEEISALGELGVVFLLFLIGLELSFERLMTMRRLVFGLGAIQVVVTIIAIVSACLWLGFNLTEAIILGMALSLSSTAIVVQLFSEEKRLGSRAGRTSFAILLFQDLAVIPILLTVSVLGQKNDGPILVGVLTALAQAGLAIVLIVGVGRYALRPLLKLVAETKSADFFMAAVLLIAVGTGVLANAVGLSMALGAFIAGLMLAETEYRRAIEAIIEPFKGLLLGAFFLVVGLDLDLSGLFNSPLQTLSAVILLISIKAVIIYGLSRAFRIGRDAALETALVLGPCGEFAFVVFSAALALGLFKGGQKEQALLIVSLTMILIPLLAFIGKRLARRLRTLTDLPSQAQIAPPTEQNARVIIAGFGRVGHLIGSMLDEHKISYIALDNDPALVARERKDGFPVFYGNAANPEFLRKCGLDTAFALAVTMDSPMRVDDVTKTARAAREDLKIIARARDERHAMRLYLAGASEAIPETVESSLQLGESLLVESGVPMGLAIASVHERRDGFRKMLGRPDRRATINIARTRLRQKPK